MRLEQAVAFPSRSEFRCCRIQVAIDRFQLHQAGTLGVPVKRVRQRFENSFRLAVMNERVSTIQIAQRFRQAMWNLFEDKPSMRGAGNCCPSYDEPQLEGHIESRRPRHLAIDLDSRKIVK